MSTEHLLSCRAPVLIKVKDRNNTERNQHDNIRLKGDNGMHSIVVMWLYMTVYSRDVTVQTYAVKLYNAMHKYTVQNISESNTFSEYQRVLFLKDK